MKISKIPEKHIPDLDDIVIIDKTNNKHYFKLRLSEFLKERGYIKKEEHAKDLYDFFMWFRKNGEKYIETSIKKMIQIYLDETNNEKTAK
jgi:homospermidine synthase